MESGAVGRILMDTMTVQEELVLSPVAAGHKAGHVQTLRLIVTELIVLVIQLKTVIYSRAVRLDTVILSLILFGMFLILDMEKFGGAVRTWVLMVGVAVLLLDLMNISLVIGDTDGGLVQMDLDHILITMR